MLRQRQEKENYLTALFSTATSNKRGNTFLFLFGFAFFRRGGFTFWPVDFFKLNSFFILFFAHLRKHEYAYQLAFIHSCNARVEAEVINDSANVSLESWEIFATK